MITGIDGKTRCFGGKNGDILYANYHDNEWGIPVHDDRLLFEMLCLEGAQAGLSWETVLKKRDGYAHAFYNFEAKKIIKMSDDELEALRHDASIIRNKLKIYAVRKNAHIFLDIQQDYTSFARYIWGYVNHKSIISYWQSFDEVPVSTPISDAISKDLKKRGMSFVGSTIIYAYMQAIGMVDDHIKGCCCYHRNRPETQH